MFSKLQKYSSYLILSLIILASSWSLFNSEFFRFHDFTQGARIVEMTTALKDGHFPVIWSSNLGYGYGMPLFEFYAPLPYYVGSIFYMLGFSLVNSVKAIILISSFVTAIGAFYLGKKLYGQMGGLLVSSAITLAPYRAVNLFVRGAISEAWGIMALPFILLGIVKTVKNEKFGWQTLVIAIVVLLLSHNLTALVFLPFSIIFGAGYLLIESRTDKNLKNQFWHITLKLAAFYLLALAMSLFYTAPAFLEKDFTRLEITILAEYFNYKLHFVGIKQFFLDNWGYGGSTYGPMDGISFYLGFGQLAGLFLSLYLVINKYFISYKNKTTAILDKHLILYSLICVLFGMSLIMTTNKSMIIWESIDLLSFLQFPWRYLSAAIVFLGLILGYLTILLPNKIYKISYGLVLTLTIITMNSVYFQPEAFISDLEEYYYSDANKLRTDMSTTLPDYIPAGVTQDQIIPVALEGQVLHCQVISNCELGDNGEVNFKVIENKVHKKKIITNFNSNKEVVFTISNFPGWTAELDSQTVTVLTSDDGFVSVFVPAGEHIVTVTLRDTPIRTISTLISMAGLVIFSSLFFWYYKKK
jgi:hypothetical protein